MQESLEMDWDLSDYFPSFAGPEYARFFDALKSDTKHLIDDARKLDALSTETLSNWTDVVVSYEKIAQRWGHLSSYIGALASACSDNAACRREEARLSAEGAAFEQLEIELLRALRRADLATLERLVAEPALDGAQHYLRRLHARATHTMPPELESLAADLAPNGFEAWGRLYDSLAASLHFEMVQPDGTREKLPMSRRRSLMADPDRRVRQAAFDGGNAAWRSVQDTAAAALNHIAGTRHTLNQRRGVPHFLDVARQQAAVSDETLNALFEAVSEGAHIARRFLALKARCMGIERISWFDLEAPLPVSSNRRFTWDEAVSRVESAFSGTMPELTQFFRSVIDKRYVDHTPRPGKRPGAFCTSSSLINQSRVFMTFQGSVQDVSTLAHEVGHAYHNYVMGDLRPLARRYPMTLAESASTFAELVLNEGLLAAGSLTDADRVVLLGETLGDAASFLLDIPVRFEFEKSFYEARQRGEVSADELSDLMTRTQRRIFGSVLDENGTDPLFWASKLHFYITDVTFYNFPYTFGYLLSRWLFARFKRRGAAFLPEYTRFLRETGRGEAHEIARRVLGQDLESKQFWLDAIATLEQPLSDLERMLPSVLPERA